MIKECKKHGLTEFRIRKEGGVRCKKCAVDSVTKRRQKVKSMAIEYKGGKCSICDYNKCVSALEFHHLEEDHKDFGISSSGYSKSWYKIKKELDKCILVCANCHREIHSNILEV